LAPKKMIERRSNLGRRSFQESFRRGAPTPP
jgi:hypothetical protein